MLKKTFYVFLEVSEALGEGGVIAVVFVCIFAFILFSIFY